MVTIKNLCGIILLLFFAAAVNAEVAVPAVPDRVVDQANLFSGSGREKVLAAIRELEKATGGQMVVWTIPSLEGEAIETVSMRAAEKWKIGHKGKDNGVLLTIAQKDRSIRLEIGYGWEGRINDARAGDIIREMGPCFRAGDYAGGAVLAVNRVRDFVTGKTVPAVPVAPASNKEFPIETFFWVFMAIIVVVALIGKAFPGSGLGGGGRGGWSSGGGGGWSSGGGGGGFSGGGGSFGGGGASGKW